MVIPGPTSCACCGGTCLSKLGEDITETLEVIPRQWKVIQHVIPKLTDMYPCDRDYFALWLGRPRRSMQKHRTSGITLSQRKRTRPKVGQIGLPASLCRSPDGPASRIAPRLAGQTDLAPSHGCISVSFGIT